MFGAIGGDEQTEIALSKEIRVTLPLTTIVYILQHSSHHTDKRKRYHIPIIHSLNPQPKILPTLSSTANATP